MPPASTFLPEKLFCRRLTWAFRTTWGNSATCTGWIWSESPVLSVRFDVEILARREEEVHGAGVPVAGRSGTANPRVDGVWAGPGGGGEGDASSLSLRWRWGFLIAGENIFGGTAAELGTSHSPTSRAHGRGTPSGELGFY
uniref:Uncharacterized protein n=1 Tax=Arundo donax TaxID=35708 RepID=A0A0A9DFC9_ARUDO